VQKLLNVRKLLSGRTEHFVTLQLLSQLKFYLARKQTKILNKCVKFKLNSQPFLTNWHKTPGTTFLTRPVYTDQPIRIVGEITKFAQYANYEGENLQLTRMEQQFPET